MTFTPEQLPFTMFSRQEWSKLRENTPMTLSSQDIAALKEPNDPIGEDEVIDVYLPLCRLITMWVEARSHLHDAASRFLQVDPVANRVPWVIGIAGSVGAGKSTAARLLQALLARSGGHRVELVSTDAFLYPNKILEERGLMDRKGFPESYDQHKLLRFLQELKDSAVEVETPVYSHTDYDIIPNVVHKINAPQILLVEGLNVLQPARLIPGRDFSGITVSDYIDFSIYVDAPSEALEQWFLMRFHNNIAAAHDDPKSFYHQFIEMSREEATAFAQDVWRNINLLNYTENIRPTRNRASCILQKDAEHSIKQIWLRKF